MKKIISQVFTFVAILFSLNGNAQDSMHFTLQQCIETAISNNLTVKQSDLLNQSAEVNLKQAKANRWPLLSADINHGINEGRSIDPFTNRYLNQQINFANYGLNTSIVLFNGNNITNNIRRNEFNVDATKMDLQQSKDVVTLNVILAYLTLLSNEDQLKQNRNQAELTSRQVDRLETLNKDGAIIPSQLYDLKGQLANDQLAIVNSENAVDAAKLNLAQLMNIPFSSSIEVTPLDMTGDPALYDATTKMIYESACKNLGYVKATEFRKLSAEKALKAAKGLVYPYFYLSAGLFTNISSAANTTTIVGSNDVQSGDWVNLAGNKLPVYTTQNNFQSHPISYGDQFSNNYNSSVYLGIRIPILNSLQTRTQIRQAKISLSNAAIVEETTKLQLQQQIEQAAFNMHAAFKKFKTLKDQVEAFSESFREADVRFNAGVINSVEYLVVKNSYDRANINLIVARYEYLLRTKVLDYYQSKPLW